MTTYLELQQKVARKLSDTGNTTFEVTDVQDMIAAAWAEVSDITPERFTEDITPVADTSSYIVRSDAFDGVPNEDIQLVSVEIWTVYGARPKAWKQIQHGGAHPMGSSYSQAGWSLWGGVLWLPDSWIDMIDPDKHLIHVKGYSPWPLPVEDADLLPFNATTAEDVVLICRIEALRQLTNSRSLFTQWQTRTNNTDVSMASLNSDLSVAIQEWSRRSNRHRVTREAPG